MGKQIRFYQTELDEKLMFSFFAEMNLVVYSAYISLKTPKVAEATKKQVCYDEVNCYKQLQLYITTTTLCNRQNALISFTSNPGPAVEFIRCMQIKNAGGYIDHGRFWIDSALYGNKELVSVYNKLVRYVKNHYTYCPKLGAYVGKDAYEKWKNKEFNMRYSFDDFGN